MKVNPVAIQSYQNLHRQDRSQAQQAETRAQEQTDKKVVIEPHNQLTRSAVAVKGPSEDYTKHLSQEEQRALELLFERFRNTDRFAKADGDAASSGIGNVVDIKV
ncbi:hypothetical protein GF377_00815 [candidate division GN15 bacterium]|nr:hypothetical protein [candidate division GN15 bacterium]